MPFCLDDSSFVEQIFLNLCAVRSSVLVTSFSLKSKHNWTWWKRWWRINMEMNLLSRSCSALFWFSFSLYGSHLSHSGIHKGDNDCYHLPKCRKVKSLAQGHMQVSLSPVQWNIDYPNLWTSQIRVHDHRVPLYRFDALMRIIMYAFRIMGFCSPAWRPGEGRRNKIHPSLQCKKLGIFLEARKCFRTHTFHLTRMIYPPFLLVFEGRTLDIKWEGLLFGQSWHFFLTSVSFSFYQHPHATFIDAFILLYLFSFLGGVLKDRKYVLFICVSLKPIPGHSKH